MKAATGEARRLSTILVLALWSAGCNGGETKQGTVASLPPTPAEHRAGEAVYEANCAVCHGRQGSGTTTGPPLAHKIYEPSHHGDASFRLAAMNGVAAHHWRFGNMPPQPQVSDTQLTQVIGYVRWVQRQVGIE